MKFNISGIEAATGWSKNVGPTINPTAPDGYELVQTPGGLRLYCCGKPYAGWLAKHVAPLYANFTDIPFNYSLVIDDATPLCAQVIETDTKFTDADGWTYDGSFQWNIQQGWVAQTGNPWQSSAVKIPALMPGAMTYVSLRYALDYVAHTLQVVSVSVNGTVYPINSAPLPAKQSGWAKSEIVTQLQQCINGKEGAYSVLFPSISYDLSL